ncbi:MAG: SIS domain-containing protein [Symbiobacteriia bacterium]
MRQSFVMGKEAVFMSAAEYFKAVGSILSQVAASQGAHVSEAGRLAAEAVANGGLIHAFGTGHSHLLAEEVYYRAGGLLTVNAILEPALMLHEGGAKSSAMERLPGLAKVIFDQQPAMAGDVIIIASNSGRNAVPIEMAMEARQRGLKVIAITSRAHAESQPAGHASGKKLHDVADVVIDNGGVPGDAVLTVPGLPVRACGTSTVIGAAIMQAIMAEVVDRLIKAGKVPPVIQSGNVEGSLEYNTKLFATYGDVFAKRFGPAYGRR